MAFSPVFECKDCHSRNAIWHITDDVYSIICRGCGHAGTVPIKAVSMMQFLKNFILNKQDLQVLAEQWDVLEKFLKDEQLNEKVAKV